MDAARTLIHSARLVTDGQVVEDAWVLFEAGLVSAIGSGAPRPPSALVESVDAAGMWLTPGFIDIHCHGGGGASFDGTVKSIRTAIDAHGANGTTRMMLSLVTAPLALLEERLSTVATLARTDNRILGSHLEGPFLHPGHKGAHDPGLLHDPRSVDVDRMIEAGGSSLTLVTLAPELPGALSAIARFSASGVVVAVGHTDADYAQTIAAFQAGATILTHAFNGMNPIHHRAPGPVVAAFDSPQVTAEIINDGVHLDSGVVRLAFASAPGRIAFVSDAMAAAGSNDGDYLLGGLVVTVRGGVARLDQDGSIAGSTITLDAAVRRAVQVVGVPLPAAVSAATETPARAIGRGHDLGRLAPGYLADAVLLDSSLAVAGVWVGGRRAPSPAPRFTPETSVTSLRGRARNGDSVGHRPGENL